MCRSIYIISSLCVICFNPEQQKIEEVKVEELPKLRKVEVKPKEEPAKKEVTKTKVKIPKAKKYEELPEIPDYERAELEKYEESEFELSKKAGEKEEMSVTAKPQQAVESIQEEEKPKNGLPKVSDWCTQHNSIYSLELLLYYISDSYKQKSILCPQCAMLQTKQKYENTNTLCK